MGALKTRSAIMNAGPTALSQRFKLGQLNVEFVEQVNANLNARNWVHDNGNWVDCARLIIAHETGLAFMMR